MLQLHEIDKINHYSPEQWQSLLALIPILQTMNASDNPKDFRQYHHIASQFCHIVYAMPIVIVFDWAQWIDKMKSCDKYHDDLQSFAHLSLVELCQLITAMVRAGRFHDHLIEQLMSGGQMLKILQAIEFNIHHKLT